MFSQLQQKRKKNFRESTPEKQTLKGEKDEGPEGAEQKRVFLIVFVKVQSQAEPNTNTPTHSPTAEYVQHLEINECTVQRSNLPERHGVKRSLGFLFDAFIAGATKKPARSSYILKSIQPRNPTPSLQVSLQNT